MFTQYRPFRVFKRTVSSDIPNGLEGGIELTGVEFESHNDNLRSLPYDEAAAERDLICDVVVPEDLDARHEYDKGLWTRNACLVALVLSWISGVATLATGIALFVHPIPAWQGAWSAEIGSLVVNLVLTLMLEGIGFIHGASLRWALQAEGRLKFNSNLRLFVSSHRSMPNSWPVNTIYLIGTITAYASASLLFQKAYNIPAISAIHPAALTLLGISLLLLAGLVTWSYLASHIPTWSSCPLDTVLACLQAGSLHRHPGRCMMGLLDRNAISQALPPRKTQPSSWSCIKQIRMITALLWFTVLLCALGAAGVYGEMKASLPNNTNGSLVNWSWDWGFITNLDTSPALTVWLNIGPSGNDIYLSDAPAYWISGTFAQIALTAAAQSVITAALHATEQLVNVQRDERFWRSATTPRGCNIASYRSALAFCRSPNAILLFLFKAVIHWYFGQAIIPTYDAIGFGDDPNYSDLHSGAPYYATGKPFTRFELAQIVYLTLGLLIFAAIFTGITLYGPRGPQPAAYGHLQTLADLVDEWHGTLYWGHKKDGEVCHAGTAGHALSPVRPTALYSGGTGTDGRDEGSGKCEAASGPRCT